LNPSPVIFQNVSHRYDSTIVLDNLTFEIESNLITAVIGRSGSGKSTLLQIINGLIVPSDGTVKVFGRKLDYARIHELRLQMGYSVQGTGLFPHLNAYDNIYLLAKISGKSNAEVDERIDKLLKFVNLDPSFKSKYPFQLSGGEQQRVGICRAMVLNPPIFLLDEPFAALDPTTKFEIHSELLNLQRNEPRTIIMVTHDMHEALKLADRIMFLETGVIQQCGTKEEFMNFPANETVRKFIKTQL
jgi:osmoprotectant transport system ATP-binding protein